MGRQYSIFIKQQQFCLESRWLKQCWDHIWHHCNWSSFGNTIGASSNRPAARQRWQQFHLNREAYPFTRWDNYHSIWLESDGSRSTRASIGEYIISEEPQGVLETTLYGDESTPVKYIIIQSLGLFYIFSTLKLNNSKTTHYIFKKLTFLKTRDKTTSI